MRTDSQTIYTCEFCNKSSYSYDEIEECERICESISREIDTIIKSLNKLNNLGCTIELREFPYYENNKLDLAVARRLSKDYKLVFRANDILPNIKVKEE